jgi:hypothetical protein
MMVTDERVTPEELAEELTRFRGQWVAIKDNRVVEAAATPAEVIDRLTAKGEVGWVLDRVPEDPNAVYVL